MARVRAISEGFDNMVMRQIGEEFDMDAESQGLADWFEYLDPADEKVAREAQTRRKLERTLRPQIEGELLAEQIEQRAKEHAAIEAEVRKKLEAEMRAKLASTSQ